MYYICTLFSNNQLIQSMRNVFFIVICLLGLSWSSAQKHEIGGQLGAINLVGDIGKTNHIYMQNPFRNNYEGVPITVNFSYKRNFNAYQGLRFTLGYGQLVFFDSQATEEYRKQRRHYGSNTLLIADVEFVYNFFPVNDEQRSMVSPYIFGGLGGLAYSSLGQSFNNVEASLPFGVGLKYKFNYNWAVFGEFKFRYAFTDGLDYSDTNYGTEKVPRYVGNPNSNDWANTITLGLSYSFGRPPCDCQ